MPIRRRRRSKVAGVPPPPVVKIKAPRYHELKEIYRKLVTANQTTRVAALFEAFDWYDYAIKYWMAQKQKMTPEQIKKFGIANKLRNLAIGGSNDNEKETAAINTIKALEKTWSKEPVPSVQHYYKKYEENKAHLEAKEAAATAKYQEVLEALNTSFKDVNLTFELVKHTNSGNLEEFDGINKIIISIALVKAIKEKIKTEGLLPALFSEAYTVIKASGIETVNDPDAPGQVKSVPNLQKMVQSVPLVLEGILKFINTASPKRIFKNYAGTLAAAVNPAISAPTSKIHKVKTTTVKTGHKHHAPRGGGALVGGRYQAGSAMAILYQRLEDQKVHALGDLFQGLGVNNPKDRLKYLIKHGQRSGNWSIILQGNTAKMVKP
jgi:hypothetical protein